MKVNCNKCHLITNKRSFINLKIGKINIKNGTWECMQWDSSPQPLSS